MAGMKDVAKLAGVSISTVSRVINGTIPVDDATKKRVQDAINKVNFKPNLLARGLRSKSGHMIGLAVPEILHETFVYFIKYTEELAAEMGFNIVVGNTHGNPDIEERFIDSLIQRHIDGIIFSRVSDNSRVLHILDKTDIPIVVLDRALDVEDVPTVVLDNFRAGELAAEHLISLNHGQLCCISGPLDIALSRERLSGFKSVLKRRGVILKDECIVEGDFGYDSGMRTMEEILSRKVNCTAIWAQSDLMAIGAMNVLHRAHKSVPGDISIMGMDNINLAEMKFPTLTTISQPFREMCSTAFAMLFNQKKKIALETTRVVLQPELVIRESTASLKGLF